MKLVLKARVVGSVGDGGATIAVRSVRSGLPLRHLRHSLRLFLQIPSGASTRPAIPHRPHHALAMRLSYGLWGGWCAWHACATSGREGEICGARPKRPRGRPFGAYAVSCVCAMTLSRVATRGTACD